MLSRSLSLAVILAVAATACSTGDGGAESADADRIVPSIIAATPTPSPVDGASDAGSELAELPEEEEGVLVNRFDLDPGDCFNTYGVVSPDDDEQPTTRVVECERAHESEVYLQRNFPGGPEEPYPGDDQIRRWAEERCFRDFEDFTGKQYELSELEIGVIHPTRTTWTGPGLHREVTCYVFAVGGGGLQESMADAGI